MIIRQALPSDITNLRALSIQVWLHTYSREGIRDELSTFVFSTFTESCFQEKIDSRTHEILVAILNGHLVGYIAADRSSQCSKNNFGGVEITTLYVQEHFHGHGIGKTLLKEINKTCGNKLWLTTWIHNSPAIDFYLHLGFRKIGKTWFHLSGEKHENHILAMESPLI